MYRPSGPEMEVDNAQHLFLSTQWRLITPQAGLTAALICDMDVTLDHNAAFYCPPPHTPGAACSRSVDGKGSAAS